MFTAMYKTDGQWHPAVGHRELSLVLCYGSDGWVGGSSWEGRGPRERDMCLYAVGLIRRCTTLKLTHH